jgi:hypothetical protein
VETILLFLVENRTWAKSDRSFLDERSTAPYNNVFDSRYKDISQLFTIETLMEKQPVLTRAREAKYSLIFLIRLNSSI